jgi:hypothetical protein
MMLVLRLVGGGTSSTAKAPKAPQVTARGLKSWIQAEYKVFLVFVRYVATKNFEYSGGNPCMQGQNDGVTLKNGKKFNAMGVQFVDHELKQNHVICFGMKLCKDGTDKGKSSTLSCSRTLSLALSLSWMLGFRKEGRK